MAVSVSCVSACSWRRRKVRVALIGRVLVSHGNTSTVPLSRHDTLMMMMMMIMMILMLMIMVMVMT